MVGAALRGRPDVEMACLKSQDGAWIGSVQGAVATWSTRGTKSQ